VLFDGFLKVYKVSEEEDDAPENVLPDFSIDEILDLLELIPSQHFTKAPGRYSESSLVKALEEDGVGRPSTYAPIIQTIVMRNYVNRLKGYFSATQLGMKVSDLLVENFSKIMDIKFTAALEDELDEVEEGKLDYVKVLKDFYAPFKESLEYAKIHVQKEIITTDEYCPQCNSVLIIKWGRRGQFLSCSKFPECKFSKSITTGIKCPAEGCAGELIERRSRRGAFYGCSKFPNCKYITDKLPEELVKDDEPKKTNP
jgi:DNA topoisomerase-1